MAEWRSLPSHAPYEVVQWHVQTVFPYLLRENMSNLVGLLRLSNRVMINKAMSLFGNYGGLVILCSDRTWSILWFLDGDIPFCERDISCGELGMSFETQSIPLWELLIYYTLYYFMFNLVFVDSATWVFLCVLRFPHPFQPVMQPKPARSCFHLIPSSQDPMNRTMQLHCILVTAFS